MIKQAGMTPIAFNDGIEFANKMSASVGSTTYTFDRDIVVCYWSGGWSGYTPRTAAQPCLGWLPYYQHDRRLLLCPRQERQLRQWLYLCRQLEQL